MKIFLGFLSLLLTVHLSAQSTYNINITGDNHQDTYNSSTVTKEGNLLIASSSIFFNPDFQQDIYLINIDKDGNKVWSKRFDLGGNDSGFFPAVPNEKNMYVAYTEDNHILVCASRNDDSLHPSIVFLKLDSSGTVLWAKNFTSQFYKTIIPFGITEDSKGGIIIAYNKATEFPVYNYLSTGIVRFDKNGNFSWQQTVNPAQSIINVMHNRFIKATLTGGVAILGVSDNNTNSISKTTFLQIDQHGNVVQFKSINNKKPKVGDIVIPQGLYEPAKNKFSLFGEYRGNGGYFYNINFDSSVQQVFSTNIKSDILSLHLYAQRNIPMGTSLTLSHWGSINVSNMGLHLSSDRGLISFPSAFNTGTDINLKKYDSSGRICPDFLFPASNRIDTNYQREKYLFAKMTYTIINDQIISQPVSVITYNADEVKLACNGASALSSIAGLGDINNSAGLSSSPKYLFPNPAFNSVYVPLNMNHSEVIQVRIISLTGKTVGTYQLEALKGTENIKIDISKLSSGIYFVKMNSAKDQQTYKFIKY